jgi:formamidopyrimidine-DNA glycosylase
MPELPEVETVARQLAPLLTGRDVRRLRILDPRLRNGRTPPVAGRRIRQVRRSGKRVLVGFSARRNDSGLWLAVHLRMTGRLQWVADRTPTASTSVRARFDLDRGKLLFLDTRRFGTFDWYSSEAAAAPAGVEPLSTALNKRSLRKLIAGSRSPVKPWLLRQDRIVGLGNIYASEILHRARISPLRNAGSLEDRELGRLLRATKTVLRRAIEMCGTTFSDFQDARGVEGGFQRFLAVYAREGEDCRRCGEAIDRIVQQQRSTYFCRACQT